MMSAALILNPNAGNGKIKKELQHIKEIIESTYAPLSVYETKREGDGARLVKELESKVDLIIGAGGDGTIHELINAMCKLETRPLFAVLPGGTCNDFSRGIGMDQNIIKAAQQIATGRVEKVDIGKSEHQYFSNFWGIGLINEVSENIEEDSKARFGKLSYYMSTAKTITNIEPFYVEIEGDGEEFKGEAVMVVVGNGAFTGGLRPFFPKNHLQDSCLDVLVVTESNVQTFWKLFLSNFSDEKVIQEESILKFQAKHVKVTTSPAQKIDCDGERKYYTPDSINVLPRFLEVIVGNF
ncbi:diacylglycerol/lipid kinase family protein [Priestia filamentosa]|uniref:Diacylglycerol kinase n=1 Tax=Priestia filamentosa TaxID=1402861 RepID=A0A1X7F7K2_9BACI|nr:diacylglycerol kinase family protein [Priestia filamentosa]AKO91778.1 diacylglycerol kinase [Priestia filamentosa]MDT3761918.1 diacylglycerol kinase family lipid kinase [Priestia filamentosa]OXS68002.1 diacylglycerol kinase [Priestia filamentosa]RJS64797.1 diacylglycerol kinase [Priestia filamentosa]WCM17006.1 diacylglycerol kinase family lipid kinase [Priestia filamentosa]